MKFQVHQIDVKKDTAQEKLERFFEPVGWRGTLGSALCYSNISSDGRYS